MKIFIKTMTLNGNKKTMEISMPSLMLNCQKRQLISSRNMISVLTKLQNSFVEPEIEKTLSLFLTNKFLWIKKDKGANKALIDKVTKWYVN